MYFNKKKYFITLILIFSLFFTACEGDDDSSTPSDEESINYNVIEITENITNVTTWSYGNVYLIRKYDFYVTNTLIIEPGVIIKFHPSDGPYMMLSGSATINAVGTEQRPIIFTSYKDDDNGGDTNNDNSATSPARKDWGYINTNGTNGSTFKYCNFYYGGDSTYNQTLSIESGSIATIQNCTFVNNDGSYASAAGDVGVLEASSADAGTIIKNNIFYNNVRPLSINTKYDLDNSNVFHNPANPLEKNTYNGIFVETIDHINSNITWSETEVAYVIDDNDWWIESGSSLTTANNVVLKFKAGSYLLLESGISNLNNYNGAGVVFTSYKDDNYKGDTNADGNTTIGASDRWGGVYDDFNSFYYSWSNILNNIY